MRKIAYALILVSLFFAPVSRLDVARLEPVGAVALYREKGRIVLETDTGSIGRGATVAEAATELERACEKVIYLDTAKYLLLGEGAAPQIQELKEYLKGSVKVGPYRGGEVSKEAQLLQKEEELPKLRDLGS